MMRVAIRERLGLGATGEIPRTAAWSMRDGMRLSLVRRTLLKVLQPFADRQNELNGRHADSVERALFEMGMVRRRVWQLERLRELEPEVPVSPSDGQDDSG